MPCWGFCLVGVKGFEPSTSASRTQRSTKLSHTPQLFCNNLIFDLIIQLIFYSVKCLHLKY